MLPGALQTIKLSEKMGVEPKEVKNFFKLQPGDPIEKGQVIAETKGFMGMFKSTVISDHGGTVESLSEISGHVLVREASIPVEVTAYIQGKVADILPNEGAIVETRCAMVQGIFGVGGERTGEIRVAVNSPNDVLDASMIQSTDAGKILIGGSGMSYDAIKKASEVGVTALVAGG